MSSFEIRAKDGMARIGRFSTPHGMVESPLLMPVVHPGKISIPPSDLKSEFGFQMVITNSYIIKSREKFREVALSEGVHSLIDFDGPVMTDSGTFQMYYHGLPVTEIDPLEIIEFQKGIQPDIGTILDVFSAPDVGKEQVTSDVELSLQRARLSVQEKEDMLLAGTIQGGIYPDLREYSAKEMAKLDFDIHPIGGVVPLMESYRYSEIVQIIYASKRHLPANRPIHLFGCGHPMFFAQAAMMGCDFFDSASYAKFAEAGRMMLPSGTVHLSELREIPCRCPVCSTYSADQLREMNKDAKRLQLMRHNLYVSAAEISRVKQAIFEGKLMELVAQRARGHPTLYDAMEEMLQGFEEFERWAPRSTSGSILYSGGETSNHPVIEGFHRDMIAAYENIKTENLVLFPHHGDRPFADAARDIIERFSTHPSSEFLLVFATPIGAVPWELEHVHPVQQCIYPYNLDRDTLHISAERINSLLDVVSTKNIYWLLRNTPINTIVDRVAGNFDLQTLDNQTELLKRLGDAGPIEWENRKLRFLFKYQWELDASDLLQSPDIETEVSRGTGKIRHIRKNGEILFTLVPTTGLLTPTYEGGIELVSLGLSDKFKVVMFQEASEFVAKGKSALAKFVKDANPELRAGEEVLIFDESENLVGTGRTLLSGFEMLDFERGVAVTVRHSMP